MDEKFFKPRAAALLKAEKTLNDSASKASGFVLQHVKSSRKHICIWYFPIHVMTKPGAGNRDATFALAMPDPLIIHGSIEWKELIKNIFRMETSKARTLGLVGKYFGCTHWRRQARNWENLVSKLFKQIIFIRIHTTTFNWVDSEAESFGGWRRLCFATCAASALQLKCKLGKTLIQALTTEKSNDQKTVVRRRDVGVTWVTWLSGCFH